MSRQTSQLSRPTSRLYLAGVAAYFALTLISFLISNISLRSNTSGYTTLAFPALESFLASNVSSSKSAMSLEREESALISERKELKEQLTQEMNERLAVLDQRVQRIRSLEAAAAAAAADDVNHEDIDSKYNQTQSRPVSATSKYAYAFVIGGCRPERPQHRGFIYNILVARQVLREYGSKADMVALIQMSSKSNATELDDVDAKPLKAMDVQIKYVPKDKEDSFYGTVLRKFDILDLTQYSRVILMDGDVLPLGNLDYFFELSEGPNPLLKPNFVVNGPWEPSNAGFFMLEPGVGYLDEVKEIIKRREESSPELGFDRYIGWGHPIEPPDEWVARQERGTNWTFLFAESDQGLLYYYTKYHRKSVSLIQYGARVENWGTDADGKLVKEGDAPLSIKNYSRPFVAEWRACVRFLCDFQHFTGDGKPWQRHQVNTSNSTKYSTPRTLWWYTLKSLNKQLGMGLDFRNWTIIKGQPLGYYANKKQTILKFKAKPEK